MPRTLRTVVNTWSRKLHRWGAILTLAPVGVIIISGLFLQLKKESGWIQPPSQKGAFAGRPHEGMTLSLRDIYEKARAVPQAQIDSWDDIDRFDVRPDKGMVKVRCANRWEVQVDAGTGEILQVAYRRSDLIESIHDGSFFHEKAKLWVFLPAGAVLLGLWLTGAYLWVLPIWSKRAGRKRREAFARAREPRQG